MLRRLGGTFFFAGFMLFLAVFPFMTEAASCGCWCSKPGGAVEVGVSDTDSFQTECSAMCEDEGGSMLGCFTADQEDYYPENNQRCWTEYECANDQNQMDNGSMRLSTWGTEQPSECIPGEHYCYAPLNPIDLSVAIGGVTQATDLGAYIAAFYAVLIPIAGLLAVVMMMIAGLQWMLARGNAGGISQAKERIGHAVLGVVLVLGAYSIAYIIDPSLTNLEALRVPKIRKVVFLDPASSCEALEAYGFEVQATSGLALCGDKGIVTSVDNVSEELGETVIAVGHTCDWVTCEELGEVCVAEGSERHCQRCADSYSKAVASPNEGAVAASPLACGQLQSLLTSKLNAEGVIASGNNEQIHCAFVERGPLGYDACVQYVYPKQADYSLVCDTLRKEADALGLPGCNAYRIVSAEVSGVPATVSDAYMTEVFEHLCVSDPCGFAEGGKCVFSPGMIVNNTSECLNPGE